MPGIMAEIFENLSNLWSKVNNEHNVKKSYEEAHDMAEEMNVEFRQPNFHSDTRCSNHASKVLKVFIITLVFSKTLWAN